MSEDKKRPMILARIKPPGPAAYSLPSTFSSITNKRAPAYSIGGKQRPRVSEQSGPLSLPGFPGAPRAPSFSLTGRRKLQVVSASEYTPCSMPAQSPSPASYSLPATRRHPGPSFTGRNYPDIFRPVGPGPGGCESLDANF